MIVVRLMRANSTVPFVSGERSLLQVAKTVQAAVSRIEGGQYGYILPFTQLQELHIVCDKREVDTKYIDQVLSAAQFVFGSLEVKGQYPLQSTPASRQAAPLVYLSPLRMTVQAYAGQAVRVSDRPDRTYTDILDAQKLLTAYMQQEIRSITEVVIAVSSNGIESTPMHLDAIAGIVTGSRVDLRVINQTLNQLIQDAAFELNKTDSPIKLSLHSTEDVAYYLL